MIGSKEEDQTTTYDEKKLHTLQLQVDGIEVTTCVIEYAQNYQKNIGGVGDLGIVGSISM